jgi:hypothetical protein
MNAKSRSAAAARLVNRWEIIALGAGLSVIAAASIAGDSPAPCEPRSAGGPLFITETCIDPALTQPYIDINEQRSATDAATNITVRYRYIHGGFTGTGTRFAFYFPAASEYRGRFFESTYPTVSTEDVGPATIAFAITNGAYVVSTNNNGGVPFGGALAPYRANAAAAKYSRIVAEQVYGKSARPRGYLSGASGGAYQTLGSAENTKGVWDGFVPMVPGTPNAIPSSQAVALLGLRVLNDKLPRIVDSQEPGGSGNPYAGLSVEQRSALREITQLGFPLRGWWDHQRLSEGSFYAVQGAVRAIDPGYVNDFWSLPGYAGTQPSVQAARVQEASIIVNVISTNPSGVVLQNVAPGHLLYGADMTVTSGAAAGQTLSIQKISGNTVTFAGASPAVLNQLQPGDTVQIDNSWSIALQYFPRHQVPSPDMYGWNQYRDANGDPIYPQRPLLIGPLLAASTSGAVATGQFHGKMIMLASLLDVEAFPWPADWYRSRASAALGDNLDDNYRLWYMDNAGHTEPRTIYSNTHIVAYDGALQQALLDLDAWVTGEASPPDSTRYFVDDFSQLHVPASAAKRKGVQPVVTLAAAGTKHRGRDNDSRDERVIVKRGQTVRFLAEAQVPRGAGEIVSVAWDFEGDGTYSADTSPSKGKRRPATIRAEAAHAFSQRGTYFVGVRVAAQRESVQDTPYGRVENLARIRVIVE